MTYTSGPQMPESAQAHGFALSGDETAGYRARILLGLTADEAAYGCVEILFARTLPDLLTQCQAQKIIRSMVGQARGEAS